MRLWSSKPSFVSELVLNVISIINEVYLKLAGDCARIARAGVKRHKVNLGAYCRGEFRKPSLKTLTKS